MAVELRTPELRTDVVFLFDLVKQLTEGRTKIPRFQRPFVWRRKQITDLLDSINHQFPIGSLLAWETDEKVVSLRSVGPVMLQADGGQSASYVLDGHQRLSTIAGTLVSTEDRGVVDENDPDLWSIYYNASDDSFEHAAEGERLPHHFPMAKLLDTFDFLDESQRFVAANEAHGRAWMQRVQSVARAFQNYKVPVISIRQTGLTEAVEIFARLNSRGQSMTADQMVSALLYREGEEAPFDLAGEIESLLSRLTRAGFEGIERTLILRALLAAIGEDIYRTDWTRFASSRRDELLDRLRASVGGVQDSFDRAVDFLRDEVGVTSERLLPYGMQFVVISSFFYACEAPSRQQIALLRQWFWVTSFGRWFGGANPSRVNALVRDVMDSIAKRGDRPSFSSFDMKLRAAPIPSSFDMRSARTRALLLVLFSRSPLDRLGEGIEDPQGRVRKYGPEALGHIASSVPDKDLVRSPANRLLRDDMRQGGQARGWLTAVHNGSERADEILASHGISREAAKSLASGAVVTFLRQRLAAMIEMENDFMIAEGVKPPLDSTPRFAPVDTDD